jgi:hypothetical protein
VLLFYFLWGIVSSGTKEILGLLMTSERDRFVLLTALHVVCGETSLTRKFVLPGGSAKLCRFNAGYLLRSTNAIDGRTLAQFEEEPAWLLEEL